jgi:hypothetical protein
VALEVVDGGKKSSKSTKGSKEWATYIRREARKLARDMDTGYMRLAKYLWEVYDTPIDGNPLRAGIYMSWGYSTFTEYAQKELGLSGRKAEYLKGIWYRLYVEDGGMNLPKDWEERLIQLGYAKVRELVRIMTAETAQDWIQKAEKVNYDFLIVEITEAFQKVTAEYNRIRGQGGSAKEAKAAREEAKQDVLPDPKVCVQKTYFFYDGQHENVEQAIERAREITGWKKGKANDGQLLDLVCTEFLATNAFEKLDKATKIGMLHKIGMFFGLNLVVIDPSAPREEKIIYGFQHLEALNKLDQDDEVEVEAAG